VRACAAALNACGDDAGGRAGAAAGVVVAPRGRVFAVAGFIVSDGRIVAIDVLADPARLRALHLTVLDG